MYTLGKDFDTAETKEFAPFENPPSGGYVFVVVEAEQSETRSSNRPMVTVKLDIAEGPHKGAFAKFPKPYRQMMDGDSQPYFKGMLKNFALSNPESKMNQVIFVQRDGSKGFNASALVGMRIGGNLREVEYIKQETSETKVGLEISFLGAVKDVPLMKPLSLKKLPNANGARASAPSASGDRGYPSDWDLPL